MSNLKIEYISTADLIPYENNAKLHTDEQVEQIERSIKEFGFNDPIAIDENNTIIEGHGRMMAAKNMDLETVPCIRLEGLTDEQKRAYILVHNKLTMNTGFDIDKLSFELDNIESIDMDDYGFDIDLNFADVGDKKERADLSDKVKETYEVIVECKDESEQESVFSKLEAEGYSCRVLTL